MKCTIGKLAKQSGQTIRTLRHYDEIGLLPPSARSEAGYRLYNQADAARLHRILTLRRLGCSLAKIRATLDEPGVAPEVFLARQIAELDERMKRFGVLRDRLSRLRARIQSGGEAGLDDWLGALEWMAICERRLSAEELFALNERTVFAAQDPDAAWKRLVQDIGAAVEGGVATSSDQARELARSWMRRIRDITGNDPVLADKLKRMHMEEPRAREILGLTEAMARWIAQACDDVWFLALSNHLDPRELEIVRARHGAYREKWPPLIAEARGLLDAGAAPDALAVQDLARRLEALFHQSFSGGDEGLAQKIRQAFELEPDMRTGIGIDEALLDFLRRVRESAFRPAGVPKPTALHVAELRAAHQLLDDPPIFEDPLALRILGPEREAALRADSSLRDDPLHKALRASVAMRSRMALDEWTEAQRRGVRQYVILGAGLDATAYGAGAKEGRLIIEVDLPDAQRWKRNRLRLAGLREPDCVRYAPVDFDRATDVDLTAELERAGFRRDQPAFFSWLGVVMYLDEESIVKTLRQVVTCAPGSSILFDYPALPELLPPRQRKAMEFIAARAAKCGEPWKSWFDPEKLAQSLRDLGFSRVVDDGPEALNARYFAGRADGLRKSGATRLLRAWV